MLRKCTRYIFLLLFTALLVGSAFITNFKGNVVTNNTLNTTSSSSSESWSSSSSQSSYSDPYSSSDQGFYIKNYDIKMVVGVNNVLHITEVIDCYFYQSKHGIHRDIPIVNKVIREDGSSNTYIGVISNIKVNNEYTKSNDSNMLILKIGSASSYVKGDQSYTISYDYNLGKDNINKYDELYFNLIGLEWQVNIEKVTFSVEMPKEFDSSKVGFTSGNKGSTSNNVVFEVNDKIITGKTLSQLNANQALTIRLQLPENYFVGEGNVVDTYLFVGLITPLLILLLAVALYYIGKNKNRKPPTVEFYPPEGLNSTDVKLIYKGNVNNKDIVSLLIVLASKGYIKIEEKKDKSITAIKCKDYDGDNNQERKFMKALFNGTKKNEVDIDDLRDTEFPNKVSDIQKDINKKSNKEKYFIGKLMYMQIIGVILGICAMIAPGIICVFTGDPMALIMYVFPIVAFLVSYFANNSKLVIGYMFVWAGIPTLAIIGTMLKFGNLFVVAAIVGFASGICTVIFAQKTYFRTKEGGELYAKIVGFRSFIEKAEKEKLEMLCNEQPSYFYNILPYAYVLGVSSVWIKKFEDIAMEQPDWYISGNGNMFTIHCFHNLLANTSKASTPKSSSGGGSGGGGGFSGGGFSGGGSGGGGGGSW